MYVYIYNLWILEDEHTKMWNGFSGITESLQKTQRTHFAELTEWLKFKQGVKWHLLTLSI